MKTLAQGCSASEAGPQTRVQVCLAPGPVGPVLINTTADLSSQALRGSGWCSRYGQGGWKSPEDRQHFLREAGLGGGGCGSCCLSRFCGLEPAPSTRGLWTKEGPACVRSKGSSRKLTTWVSTLDPIWSHPWLCRPAPPAGSPLDALPPATASSLSVGWSGLCR